jgi:hypothetical protein
VKWDLSKWCPTNGNVSEESAAEKLTPRDPFDVSIMCDSSSSTLFSPVEFSVSEEDSSECERAAELRVDRRDSEEPEESESDRDIPPGRREVEDLMSSRCGRQRKLGKKQRGSPFPTKGKISY